MSWREALERVVLALERHEDGVRRSQGVHRQQAEGGRAVDEDVVVRVRERRQEPGEAPFALRDRGQLDLGPGEGDRRGHEWRPGMPVSATRSRERHAVDERVVDGPSIGRALNPQAAGCVALGVEVDHEDAGAVGGKIGSDVDHGGRLPDAALLVGAGNRLAHLAASLNGDHDREVYHRRPVSSSSAPGIRRLPSRRRRAGPTIGRRRQGAELKCACCHPSGTSRGLHAGFGPAEISGGSHSVTRRHRPLGPPPAVRPPRWRMG